MSHFLAGREKMFDLTVVFLSIYMIRYLSESSYLFDIIPLDGDLSSAFSNSRCISKQMEEKSKKNDSQSNIVKFIRLLQDMEDIH